MIVVGVHIGEKKSLKILMREDTKNKRRRKLGLKKIGTA